MLLVPNFITPLLCIFLNLHVVGGLAFSLILLHIIITWMQTDRSVVVLFCVYGVVYVMFPHLSVGCPSLMTTKAPLVPTVLIDVARYCDRRLGVLLWTSNMFITTTVHATEKGNCYADVLRAQIGISGELRKCQKLILFFFSKLCLKTYFIPVRWYFWKTWLLR